MPGERHLLPRVLGLLSVFDGVSDPQSRADLVAYPARATAPLNKAGGSAAK